MCSRGEAMKTGTDLGAAESPCSQITRRFVSRSPLFLSTIMSSPSKPLNIRGTRPPPSNDPSVHSTPLAGTPDLRALRAQYAGTPPVPNIPPRGTPGRSTPVVVGTPSTQPAIDFTSSPLRPPTTPAVGGISAARRPSFAPNTVSDVPSLDLEGLTDEEKAKVLARHLVSKEERAKADQLKNPATSESSSSHSRPSSQHSGTPQDASKAREESEPFPIPYDAPGADIT